MKGIKRRMKRTVYIESTHLRTIKQVVGRLRERRLIGPKATSTNITKQDYNILEKQDEIIKSYFLLTDT